MTCDFALRSIRIYKNSFCVECSANLGSFDFLDDELDEVLISLI